MIAGTTMRRTIVIAVFGYPPPPHRAAGGADDRLFIIHFILDAGGSTMRRTMCTIISQEGLAMTLLLCDAIRDMWHPAQWLETFSCVESE